jgi:hypothetical protein
LLKVVEVAPPFKGEDQAIDKLSQEIQVKVEVSLDDVLHQPWGQGPPLHLGDEPLLGGVTSDPLNDVLEDIGVEVRVFLHPSLHFFDSEWPWSR